VSAEDGSSRVVLLDETAHEDARSGLLLAAWSLNGRFESAGRLTLEGPLEEPTGILGAAIAGSSLSDLFVASTRGPTLRFYLSALGAAPRLRAVNQDDHPLALPSLGDFDA